MKRISLMKIPNFYPKNALRVDNQKIMETQGNLDFLLKCI